MGSRTKQIRGLRLASAVAGVVLAGVTVTPASAETVRAEQWYLDAMHAEQMWKTSTGKGVTVAVLDSGVDPDLADLRGQVLPGKDYSQHPGDAQSDYAGHGTRMAALIAATGAKGSEEGSYGLAPGAKILPVRVPDFIEESRKDGNPDDYPTYISKAIRYAADSDAQVINISLGGEEHSKKLDDAVAYALSKNKLVFAAVGNTGSGTNRAEYPAATPGVVGVGAIGENLKVTGESQRGPQVDLVAPGADMVAACKGGSEVCDSHGTSDATALASASAALIWSKHPDWTNNQVLRVLLNTASGPVSGKKRTDEIGYGAVRPRIALTAPGSPGPANEYPLPDYKAGGSAAAPGDTGAATDPSTDTSPAPTSASDNTSNTLPWILAGLGVLVLAGATGGALAARNRRRPATPTAPVPTAPQHGWAPPPQHGWAQPPQPGQQPGQQPGGGHGSPWPPHQNTNQTGSQ
ncbi:type VII secretion-associated serine protease mycosin [Streptomyces kunmingensis]|uniref:Type VII secretion-associated serine protease mycosin n=1 Tax=Streptomyces kunmingensis TaxID=68225 RepID=A0ABU6CD52_9ACTN|nr:type VII secretion-associated serine protease mycosin [Streptomyces kunmingensis]MEB3962649.1 type VII secretion-associated serine protease mycosin [Streptomyces kunmingensis]